MGVVHIQTAMSIKILRQSNYVTAIATFPSDSDVFDHDRNQRFGVFVIGSFSLEFPIVQYTEKGNSTSVTFTCRSRDLAELEAAIAQ